MKSTRILLGILILVLIVAGLIVWNHSKNSHTTTLVDSNPTTSASSQVTVTYTQDGKVDTRDWVMYSGDYSGFSVRGPKEGSWMNTDTRVAGNSFSYSPDNRFAHDFYGNTLINSLNINAIKKQSGTNVQNWIASYVFSNADKMSNKSFTTVGKYPALQFDVQVNPDPQGMAHLPNIIAIVYNDDLSRESLSDFSYHSHNLIVDGGDRYILIEYTLTGNQSYVDVYKAIIDSLEIFPSKPCKGCTTAPDAV